MDRKDNTHPRKNCVDHQLAHFGGNSTTSRREGGEEALHSLPLFAEPTEAGAWDSAAAPQELLAEDLGEAPSLDANRLSVTTSMIGGRRVHQARDFLSADYAIRASHSSTEPQDRSGAYAVFVQPRGHSEPKLISIVLDCNGNTMLRETLPLTEQEKRDSDFQGRRNFLPTRIRMEYGEVHWLQQVNTISAVVEKARRDLLLACGEGSRPRLAHKHHELAWDRTVSREGAETEFFRCFRAAQSHYPLMRLGRKKGETIKSLCEVSPGVLLAIYLKVGDLIRLEVRFKEEYFENNREWRAMREAHSDFEYRVGFLRARAWKVVKPVLAAFDRDDPDAVNKRTPIDALMALVSVTRSPKHLMWLVHSMRQNDGRLMVRSADKARYGVARKLFHRGVLLPHLRGEYRLAPEYRALLRLPGTPLHQLMPELRDLQEVENGKA